MMRHLGWKIVFGVSWIPAALLYGNFVTCLLRMSDEGIEGIAGGLGFFVLLIPVILVLGLQTGLGYLAFRQ